MPQQWKNQLRSATAGRWAARSLAWLPLALLLAMAVFWPIASLVAKSFENGLADYISIFSGRGIWRDTRNTVVIAVAVLVLSMVIGTGLAWCAAHSNERRRLIVSTLPVLPLLIPSVAAVIGWMFLLSPSVGYVNNLLRNILPFTDMRSGPLNVYSVGGIIVVSSFIFSSFVFIFVQNGLNNSGAELEEAALVSGASPARTFFSITLQQLRPSLAYGGGIVLMLALGQFAVPVLLGGPANIDVITTRMFSLLEAYPLPFGEIAALGVPLLLAACVVILLQRGLIGDPRKYVTVGGKAQNSPRKVVRWASWVVYAYTMLVVVLPLLALAYTSVSRFWRGRIDLQGLTLANFVSVFSNKWLVEAIYTSVIAAGLTIVIVIPLGFWSAQLSTRRLHAPDWVLRLIDLALLLPFAVPATLLGFALLFAYSQPPFELYGTRTIIVLAYCTIMVPYASRILASTLLSIGAEPWEAAAISGAGRFRVFLTITAPLMRSSAVSAAVIIFVLLFQEFAVSLVVRSATTQVIGGVLYDQYTAGSYPAVAVLSLIMVATTSVGVGLLVVLGGSKSLSKFSGAA